MAESIIAEFEVDAEIDVPDVPTTDNAKISTKARYKERYLGTSASSERLFSRSGKIVTPLRASLKPDKVDMLVFLSKNV